MAKKSLLCRYCKGPEQFQAEYLGNRMGFRWGVRCLLTSGFPIRSFYTPQQAQHSIDEWCTGDGRRGCRPYLLKETGHSVSWNGDLLREFDALEEHTVAKQTYYCKCGKTFQKSSTAQDSGYRLDNYDETHDCYGCPFVEPVTEGWGSSLKVKAHECRASSTKVNYTTTTDMSVDGNWVVHVHTLDLPWLDRFIRTYLQTPGIDRSEGEKLLAYDSVQLAKAFHNVALVQGRDRYNFVFQNNKLGKEARKTIYAAFFDEKQVALDSVGHAGDKQHVLKMIEDAKQAAREKVQRMEDEIFGVEDDMAKLEVPMPGVDTCPYYNGIETRYSPKGYCIDCTVRHGFDRTPYDLKSWALDAVKKGCLDKETYTKCFFFKKAEKEAGLTETENPVTVPELPVPQEPTAIIPAADQRTITDVTAEIRYYKAQSLQNIIEIGKRLIEAKEMLEHGQWGIWLHNSVEISHRTANNFMAIAEQYANSQPVANLSYTKLLALLAVPIEERDDFIMATHTVDGEEKTVDEMTKREVQQLMRERDEAKQQAKEAQRNVEQQRIQAQMRQDMEQATTRKLHEVESKLVQLKDENRRQRLDIERLENRPIDVAVQPPSTQEMDVLRNNIRHEVMQELALPDEYFAKKGIDEAGSLFMDAVGGAVAHGFIALMRMDGKAAASTLRLYITTLGKHMADLEKRLNIMLQVDRTAKEGMDDVEW